jgi:hypothetical protein
VRAVSAVIADSDLGKLCALSRQWHGNPFGLGRARDLAAVLEGIIARRSKGGDVLQADAHGDSVPELHAAALAKAAELWGPRAQCEVQSTGTVIDTGRPGRPAYSAFVYVRCLNFAEVSP